MKTQISTAAILWLVLTCGIASAASVTLEWTASVTPDVAGYVAFDRHFQKPYNFNTPTWEGPQLTCATTALDDRQTAYVVRAWKWGVYDLDGNRIRLYSQNSNEVVYTPVIEPPAAPTGLLSRILQAILRFFVPWRGSFSA